MSRIRGQLRLEIRQIDAKQPALLHFAGSISGRDRLRSLRAAHPPGRLPEAVRQDHLLLPRPGRLAILDHGSSHRSAWRPQPEHPYHPNQPGGTESGPVTTAPTSLAAARDEELFAALWANNFLLRFSVNITTGEARRKLRFSFSNLLLGDVLQPLDAHRLTHEVAEVLFEVALHRELIRSE